MIVFTASNIISTEFNAKYQSVRLRPVFSGYLSVPPSRSIRRRRSSERAKSCRTGENLLPNVSRRECRCLPTADNGVCAPLRERPRRRRRANLINLSLLGSADAVRNDNGSYTTTTAYAPNEDAPRLQSVKGPRRQASSD